MDTQRTTTGNRDDDTISALNELLRGEISAVETYQQALAKLEAGSRARTDVEEGCRSHERRVTRLREVVVQLGGEPSEGSGPWGGFAKLVEGGAKIFGEKAAIAALEEGEDHGLRNYRDNLAKLQGHARDLVANELLPEEERTHRRLSNLKHSMH